MADTQGYVGNYTDPASGMELMSAWINVSQLVYIPNQQFSLQFKVYKSQDAFQAGSTPIFQPVLQINWGYSVWLQYFSESVMSQGSATLLSQSLLYLQSLYPPPTK